TAQRLRDVATRQAEATRALDELQAAHDALARERDAEREASAQAMRDLAARTLRDLQAAQAALRDEKAKSVEAARALASLAAAHTALRREHEATLRGRQP